MTFLVTGANGFIGKNLCQLFKRQDVIKCDIDQENNAIHPDKIDEVIKGVMCVSFRCDIINNRD